MHQVHIHPQWTVSRSGGGALAERTVALLVGVAEHGSLLKACQAMQVSYRHAWQLIRQGEALLGAPLLRMERGKGSSRSRYGAPYREEPPPSSWSGRVALSHRAPSTS